MDGITLTQLSDDVKFLKVESTQNA